MADVYLHLKPAAQAELKARKATVMSSRRLGLINSDTARLLLAEINREFMRSEFFDSDPDHNIATRCGDCQKLHIMSSSVSHYKCPCTPHVERSAYVNQEVLN